MNIIDSFAVNMAKEAGSQSIKYLGSCAKYLLCKSSHITMQVLNPKTLAKAAFNNPIATTVFLASTYVANQLPQIPYYKEAALTIVSSIVIYNLAQKAVNSFKNDESRAKDDTTLGSSTSFTQMETYYSKMAALFNAYKDYERFQTTCMGLLLTLPKEYMESWLNPFGNSYDKVNSFLINNGIKEKDLVAIWKKNPTCLEYEKRLSMFDKLYGKEKRVIDNSIFESNSNVEKPLNGKEEEMLTCA